MLKQLGTKEGYIRFMLLSGSLFLFWFLLFQQNRPLWITGANLISLLGYLAPIVPYIQAIRLSEGWEKTFWKLLLTAHCSYTIGESSWIFYELVLEREAPFPGLPDFFYLLFPIVFIIGLVFEFYSNFNKFIGVRFLLDILLVILLAAILSIRYLIEPIFREELVSPMAIFISVSYPVTDLALLFGVLFLFGKASLKRGSRYGPIIAGAVLFFLTDTYYMLMNGQDAYISGGMADLCWMISLQLIGLSAVFRMTGQNKIPVEESKDTHPSKENHFLIYLSYGLMILVVTNFLLDSELNRPGPWLFVLVMVLLLMRQNLTLADNRTLVQALEKKNQELHQVNQLVQMDAKCDFLTGLQNRRGLEEMLEAAIRRAEEDGQAFALLIIDVDWFKQVNDRYGHDFGDWVLTELGSVLKGMTRAGEMIGRYGGEEFMGILPGTGLPEGIRVAERLRKAVEDHCFRKEDKELALTISIGVSLYRLEEGRNGLMVKKRADRALYGAKAAGRNRVMAEGQEMEGES